MEGKSHSFSDKLILAASQHPQERDYWLNNLSRPPVKSNFPYDHKNKASEWRFDGIPFRFSGEFFENLMKLSNRSDYSLNAILAAGLTVLLYKYTGDTDIIIGAPIYKQEKEGEFINTVLALRNTLGETMTFRGLLVQMSQVIYNSTENQDFPLEILLDDLKLTRTGIDFPLFDTLLVLENIHDKSCIRDIRVNTRFSYLRKNNHIEGLLEYNPLLYEKATMIRIIGCSRHLLREVLNNLELRLSEIEILPEEEKRQLIIDFNDNKVDFPREKTICQWIEYHAGAVPNHIAIACGAGELSYKELNKRANQLAHLLREEGIIRERLVGVLCERSPEMVIGILAVWKAGGAYIPIDVNYPFDRINMILVDSGTEVLLTKSDSFPNMDQFYMEIGSHTNVRDIIYLDKEKKSQQHQHIFKTLRYSSLLSRGFNLLPDSQTVLQDHDQTLTYQEYMGKIKQIDQFVSDRGIDMNSSAAVMFASPLYRVMAILYLNIHNIPFVLLDPGLSITEKKNRIESSSIAVLFSESRFLDELDRLLWESNVFNSYIILDYYEPGSSENEAYFKDIWDYVAEKSTEAVNDYGWSDSYTNEPFTIEEMGEYIQNFKVKLAPYLTRQSRVLDIGCGHGLVLFEIAPLAGYYLATDLSPVIIAKNKKRIHREGLHNVELKTAAASGIDRLGEKDFDIVVCSSVIHYFPNTMYLEEMIKSAIDLLKDEGIIYLDDLLDLERKGALIESTQEYKRQHPGSQVKTDWEGDLFIGIDFFNDLQQKYPEIVAWEHSRKTGHIENELSRFRYDVVLKVNKQVKNKRKLEFSLKKNRYTFRDIEAHYKTAAVGCDDIKSKYTQGEKSPAEAASIGGVRDLRAIETRSKENPPRINDLADLSYVIYTSGSTGKPKGAMVEHIGMMNHLHAKITDLRLTGNSIIAQNASHTFDISVWQFFAALIPGGKTIIYPDELVLDPERFISGIIEDRISILEVVPSYLSIMLDFLVDEDIGSLPIDYLLVTGEEIKPALVKKWFDKYPGIKMVNAYGPTEASDDITHHIMSNAPERETVSIGKPLQNLNIYIVDKHMRLCPLGVKGEICVSGVGVGRGYLSDEERTRQVFTEDPFIGERGVRLYKTGDLGCWLPDGTIEFFGRKDYQVKIRGFRIELGEIESKLLEHPAIKEAVVVDREEGIGNKYLCAYFVGAGMNEKTLGATELREFLSHTLPNHMVPAHFFQLDRLPLTPNGKIDRKTLPEPERMMDTTLTYITEEMLKKVVVKPGNIPEDNEKLLSGFFPTASPVLSEEERERILYTFNDTGAEYPREKMINQLLEEQVEKIPSCIAVKCEGRQMTYRKLNAISNRLARELRSRGIKPYVIAGLMVDRSIEMLIGILAVLKAGGAYLPIGLEYPETRARYMLEDCKSKIVLIDNKSKLAGLPYLFIDLSDKGNYQRDATNLAPLGSPADPAYINYTSGTTGKPKGVIIENRSVINLIKAIRHIIKYKEGDSILSLITVSFDVFITETFLPLSAGLKVVIGSADQQMNIAKTADVLEKEDIALLQATPSMVRSFVMDKEMERGLKRLKYLLVTGEAFPLQLLERARKITDARIYNLYGPTEATVWATVKDVTGEKDINIGKPIANTQIYILGANGEVLPIGAAGELYIGGCGIAKGYLGREELTREKFVPNPFIEGGRLYKTGDLARWLPDGDIEFLGRIDHQIQIRGLRIEPGEVESFLLAHGDIKEAIVIARTDKSGDKHLYCFVVSPKKLVDSELRDYLSPLLPQYMIPSLFIQLEKMPLLPNGKINRVVLESLDIDIHRGPGYKTPANKTEKKLVEIWSEVLGIDKVIISTDTNFFELGGHSLKATVLMSRVHKEFDTRVSLGDFFKDPTVTGLYRHLKGVDKDRYASIETAVEKDYYLLSSAQGRLYILQQMDKGSTAFNMPLVVLLEEGLQMKKFGETFERLINRHESLRTSFHFVDGQPKQKIHPEVDFQMEYYDLVLNSEVSPANDKGRGDIQYLADTIIKNFIRPFNLDKAPLLRVGLIHIPLSDPARGYHGDSDPDPQQLSSGNQHILMVDMHHIISDGVSQEILVKDFLSLYAGQELLPLKLQYKDFSEWQNRQFEKKAHPLKQQEEYWLNQLKGNPPVLNLPMDFSRPPVRSYEGDSVNFHLDPEETRALKELALKEDATLFMVLLTIFNILLAKLSGQEDIVVGTVIAGRNHVDLEKIIGIFVNVLALRNYPSGEKTVTRFLGEVRKRSIQSLDNQDYPFESLVDRVKGNRDYNRHPLYTAAFTLNNLADLPGMTGEIDDPGAPRLKVKPYKYEVKVSKIDLNLLGVEDGEQLHFAFEYSAKLFKKETMLRYIKYFKTITADVIENPRKKIRDIEMISQEEKKQFSSGIQEDREALQIDFAI